MGFSALVMFVEENKSYSETLQLYLSFHTNKSKV